ncbi:DegT/DnrJ/EryC1/StrS family aminotransferase [Tautonia plasticadhaerens]|uniref:GDP-perosamine synthase n=1 Tax=Tautonia plasticadhaerens TaxID=2527974 RepID=A0A518HFT3_9BACT|nr:DegT/DnrJ/EryC1/StrS family aminotransferase [Tautonia plasticadhaerens]QDV39703.1 UDP-4-amino-4-deoxy-L-arabinose--oxoglutarate aminotransferase [Tautonia plasticadhaerens]
MSTCTRKIPIARPSLGEEEAEAARRAILSGWITQGPEVAAFEEEFASYVGAPHACAVSSCTTALHLALHALGVGPGDEVVTVSHSFIATANAVRYCGAVPVFVDIDPRTYNMDPGLVEGAITPRTRAIIPVHQMGIPCDMPAILEIASRRGLPVVEDAACAIGSEMLIDDRWERIGRPHGTISCFSFHPRKILTTGDGGMLTTADPELDRRFRLLRQHGMSVPDTVRHSASTVIFEEYPVVGFNYRMTDIQAAIGRVQLEKLPAMLARRRDLADRYTGILLGIDGLEPLALPAWARTNFQSNPVRVTPRFPLTRDAVIQALLDRGVSTRRGIMNAHQEPSYTGTGLWSLPHSEHARDQVLLLPLYDTMDPDDQAYILDQLRELAGRES